MENKKQYLLTFEFRYSDAPNSYGGTSDSKTLTLGVFDNLQEAYSVGNKKLEFLESKFSLNKAWNRKDRLNDNKHLISELVYLETPFWFLLIITTLNYYSFEEEFNKVLLARKRYDSYKKENEE